MKITVFTPTYNRKDLIVNLYKSLCKQTFHDFEWLVIDDGSNDGTEKVFEKILSDQNTFLTRYYKFPNSGKHKEINRALDLAKGSLFFIVDSDDILTSDALLLIDKWEKSLPKDKKYCGIAGNDGDLLGNPTNKLFKNGFKDASFFDRDPDSKSFIGYDRPWVLFTNIHRQYKYPEFQDETFLTEAVVWNRMAADGYIIRCFNEVIYLREHQSLGLTDTINKVLISNPKGYGLWIKEMMFFYNYGFVKKIKRYYSFYCDLNNFYKIKEIAEFIDTKLIFMIFIDIIYKIKHRRKI